jgi:hypothetical protein
MAGVGNAGFVPPINALPFFVIRDPGIRSRLGPYGARCIFDRLQSGRRPTAPCALAPSAEAVRSEVCCIRLGQRPWSARFVRPHRPGRLASPHRPYNRPNVPIPNGGSSYQTICQSGWPRLDEEGGVSSGAPPRWFGGGLPRGRPQVRR